MTDNSKTVVFIIDQHRYDDAIRLLTGDLREDRVEGIPLHPSPMLIVYYWRSWINHVRDALMHPLFEIEQVIIYTDETTSCVYLNWWSWDGVPEEERAGWFERYMPKVRRPLGRVDTPKQLPHLPNASREGNRRGRKMDKGNDGEKTTEERLWQSADEQRLLLAELLRRMPMGPGFVAKRKHQ